MYVKMTAYPPAVGTSHAVVPRSLIEGNRFVVHALSPTIQLKLRGGANMMLHTPGIARMIKARVVGLRN